MAHAAPLNEAAIGELVHRHRVSLGLTQQELADLSGVSVRTIRDLERNRVVRPRPGTVTMIANGLRLGPRASAALLNVGKSQAPWLLRAEVEAAPPAPPRPVCPLFGRNDEALALAAELAAGERLVTIAGVAGAGKSRLAAHVANRLHAESRLPVLWFSFPAKTELLQPASGDDVVTAVVQGCISELFGKAAPAWPFDGTGSKSGERVVDAPLAEIAALTRNVPTLLVVDDAKERRPQRDVLLRLLGDCPLLQILATADAPFGVPGERVFPLGGIGSRSTDRTVSGRESLSGRNAGNGVVEQLDWTRHGVSDPRVQIFVDTARRAGTTRIKEPADLVGVSALCDLLDSLPLALQGAASWLAVYKLDRLEQVLKAGPESLLFHAAGPSGDPQLVDGLRRCVRALPHQCAVLAKRLAAQPDGTRFGLEDVAATTGMDVPKAARLLQELVGRGMAREDVPGTFRLLHLVRAMLLTDCSPSAEQAEQSSRASLCRGRDVVNVHHRQVWWFARLLASKSKKGKL